MSLVNDHYDVVGEWARGAQGRVFLAHHRRTGEAVAVKVCAVSSEDERRAFEREAALVALLAPHRNLVRFVESFVGGNQGVLVTQWVEGDTFDHLVVAEGRPGLKPSLAVAYLEQVASALDHLHSHDPPVVHGDVKPANLIRTPTGTVVVVDFGSADRFVSLGTGGYVAPELAQGAPKSARSDVFAFAATGVALLSGSDPSGGPDVDGLDPATARALRRGLAAGLAVDPRRRPPTATELVARLRSALEDEHVLSRSAVPAPSSRRKTPAAAADGRADLPLPGPLADRGRVAYVGRRDLLASLSRRRGSARRHGTRTALLTGEPGAGKTRTAAEVAADATRDGWTVLYGRCGPEAEVPYQPFAEALRWQVEHGGGDSLGPLAGELVRVLPELGSHVAGLSPPLSTDPRLEEHRTFDAVAEWLLQTAGRRGLLFVIDDLHWATGATLAVLGHVLERAATAPGGVPILLLGTYRDTDLDEGSPLLAFLPALVRTADVEQFVVAGLAGDDISALMAELSGQPIDDVGDRVARSLADESAGNPFFVIEILRNMLETGSLGFEDGSWRLSGAMVPSPDVRAVLERRFERLDDAARSSLTDAAVIGLDFDVDLLSVLTGMARRETLRLLDSVVALGLLEESQPELFRFEHALVRSTLYEAIEVDRRRHVHGGVVRSLEALGRRNPAVLATHALAAAPTGAELEAALDYALAAGEEALSARAFSDAESWSRRVLDAAESGRAPDELRVRALCLRGEAERDQGNPAFRETLLEAGRLALASGLDELVVRSALANYRGTVSVVGKVDEPRVELLRRAMAVIADDRSPRWALLAATLAGDLTYDPATPASERLDLVRRARDVARGTDDAAFFEVLLRTLAPGSVPGRLADLVRAGCELVALADATGDPSTRVMARWATTTTHLPAGEIELFRRYLDEAEAASTENCPVRVRWFATLARPQFVAASGDLEGARAANDAALALGQQAREPDALMMWSAAAYGISLLEGTIGELADVAGSQADEFPDFPVWRIGHAVALGAAGRVAEGRAVVDRHRLQEAERIPVDVLTLACWSLAALAAYHLDDVVLARAFEAPLAEHRDAWGHASVWILGPAAWDLGRCYLVERNWDGAVAALEEAVERCEEKDLPAHAAVCRADLVRAFCGRGGRLDLGRARAEGERGLEAARDFGLERRAAELSLLLDAAGGRTSPWGPMAAER